MPRVRIKVALVQAMLLAAGLGTRLWPLTEDRAKPAVPFLGQPLIRGLVELLARHGIDKVTVNTHHLAESVKEALRGIADVRFSHETEILGTAGGLALARDRGLLDPRDATLILNAKLHTDLDLSALVLSHERSGCEVTMLLRENTKREHFREVLVGNGRIMGFGEGRIPQGPNPLLFSGIHILSPRVLAGLRAEFSDTVQDVYPPLITQGAVGAHVDSRGRWWEFSTLDRYLELHHQAHREGFGSDVTLSPGARVEPGARVSGTVLWEDARIGAGAEVTACVLGRGVVLPAIKLDRTVVVRRHQLTPDARTIEIAPDLIGVRLSASP